MRTFEERMEEIQRRSEELLRIRKKRRSAIFATCVPLILTLSLLGVWLLPRGTTTESAGRPVDGEAIGKIVPEETIKEGERETIPATFFATVSTYSSSYTDHPGVTVEILSLDHSPEGLSLRVLWKNATEHDVIFGSAFFIEEQQGQQWSLCSVNENVCFTAIAYGLEPGQEREEVYNLSGVYELPEKGTCRFRAECFVYSTPEERERCELWTTFAID